MAAGVGGGGVATGGFGTPADRDAFNLLRNAVQILAGVRRKDAIGQAAVRIQDLKDLMPLPDITSANVSAAPTASDFNALRADVLAIHAALKGVVGVLQGRMK